jgi:hypothetical protein
LDLSGREGLVHKTGRKRAGQAGRTGDGEEVSTIQTAHRRLIEKCLAGFAGDINHLGFLGNGGFGPACSVSDVKRSVTLFSGDG